MLKEIPLAFLDDSEIRVDSSGLMMSSIWFSVKCKKKKKIVKKTKCASCEKCFWEVFTQEMCFHAATVPQIFQLSDRQTVEG